MKKLACLKVLCLATVLLISMGMLASAELRLNRQFGDNMVIQRDKPVNITGAADKGATVTVMFAGQKKTAKAGGDGAWSVTLDPLAKSSKGQKLTASVKGKTASVDNVVVGDVILFARQTSIDVSLGRDDAGKKAAKKT